MRPATTDDHDAVVALAAEFARSEGYGWEADHRRPAVENLLASDRWGLILVAESATGSTVEPVGYLALTWGFSIESGGVDALVDELFVQERHRGSGFGRALMAMAADCARAKGASRLNLETEADHDRVRAFYRRLGFTADDSVWMDRWL